MSFFNTQAHEDQHEMTILRLEKLFKEASKIKDADQKKQKYQDIAEVAIDIEDKAFQAKLLKKLCTKYLGNVREYTKIREHFGEVDEYESPILYDEDKCRIVYKNGMTTSVISDNFLLHIRCSLRDENEETYWILEIRKNTGEIETLEMNNKDFSSAKALKEKLLSMRYSMSVTDGQLTHIHNYLLKQNPLHGRKIIRFGYDNVADCYVFSNGVIWKDKFVEPNEHGLIILGDTAVSMPEFDKARSDANWFRYVPKGDKDLNFQQFFQHFLNAHTPEIAVQAMGHYFMTIYRDIIFHYKEATPILFFIGPKGTGKTTILRQIMYLFGVNSTNSRVSLASGITGPALTRKFSTYTNAPLLIDEFRDGHEVEGDLQASYDGNGKAKAKIRNGSFATGLEVESTPTKSSAMVSSNFNTSNEPLFSRFLWIPVMKGTTRGGEREHSFNIIEEYKDHGLSYFTAGFQKHRSLIQKQFIGVYTQVHKNLQVLVNNKKILERLIINQALILTPMIIINRVERFAKVENDVEEFHSWAIENAAVQIKEQHRQMDGQGGLSVFFDYIQRAYLNGRLRRDFEYTFIKDKAEIFQEGILAIKFPIMYNQFADDYYKKFRKAAPDKKTLEVDIATFLDVSTEKIYKQTLFFSNHGMNEEDQDKSAPKCKSSYKNAIRFPYARLVEEFGIDLISDAAPL